MGIVPSRTEEYHIHPPIIGSDHEDDVRDVLCNLNRTLRDHVTFQRSECKRDLYNERAELRRERAELRRDKETRQRHACMRHQSRRCSREHLKIYETLHDTMQKERHAMQRERLAMQNGKWSPLPLWS